PGGQEGGRPRARGRAPAPHFRGAPRLSASGNDGLQEVKMVEKHAGRNGRVVKARKPKGPPSTETGAGEHAMPEANGREARDEAANGAAHATGATHRDVTNGQTRARSKERKDVPLLIERGNHKGFLPYAELNDGLPPGVSPEYIDELMTTRAD